MYADSPKSYSTEMYSTMSQSAGERQSIIKEYEWAITDLQSVVGELTVRLQPVLAPVPGEPSDHDQPMPAQSEARARLIDLHATTIQIRNLLDRLEV